MRREAQNLKQFETFGHCCWVCLTGNFATGNLTQDSFRIHHGIWGRPIFSPDFLFSFCSFLRVQIFVCLLVYPACLFGVYVYAACLPRYVMPTCIFASHGLSIESFLNLSTWWIIRIVSRGQFTLVMFVG